MGEDEVAQEGIGLTGFHGHHDQVDDFARFGAEECRTQYFSRFPVDDGFQQSIGRFQCTGTGYGSGRKADHTDIHAHRPGFVFSRSCPGERRIDENGIGEGRAVIGVAVMIAEQVVPDDTVIVQ